MIVADRLPDLERAHEVELWELVEEIRKLEAELAEARAPSRGPARLPRLGALARWRDEVRADRRQNTGACFDDLAAAVVWEIRALEMEASGDQHTAREYLDMCLLRLRGHWVALQDLHTVATKRLLTGLRGEAHSAERNPSPAASWRTPKRTFG